jgi:hypothetical protein
MGPQHFNIHHSYSTRQGHCLEGGGGHANSAVIPDSRVQGAATWVAKSMFQMKQFGMLQSTNFQLLGHVKGNSLNGCDFFFWSSQFLLGTGIVITHSRYQKAWLCHCCLLWHNDAQSVEWLDAWSPLCTATSRWHSWGESSLSVKLTIALLQMPRLQTCLPLPSFCIVYTSITCVHNYLLLAAFLFYGGFLLSYFSTWLNLLVLGLSVSCFSFLILILVSCSVSLLFIRFTWPTHYSLLNVSRFSNQPTVRI